MSYTEPELPIEKEYKNVVNDLKCDKGRIKELQKAGKIKFIEDPKSIKDSERDLKNYAKDWSSLTKGRWDEAPPMPPKLPSDCSIM